MILAVADRKKKTILILVLTILYVNSVKAEKVSLKISYKSNSIEAGDITNWIDSFNTLWKDYQKISGGTLDGQFENLRFGPSFEFELRFPVVYGFSLNLGGGNPLRSKGNGTIIYNSNEGNQQETHAIFNETQAVPLKIGLSFSYPFPLLKNLNFFAHIGRYIIIARYKSKENYEGTFTSFGDEFKYIIQKDSTFRSENLGFYGNLGVEYSFLKFLSAVFEVEKTWAKVDGFKGPYYHRILEHSPYYRDETIISGKASLYYYESNEWSLDKYYSVLTGSKKKPEGVYLRNVRQGIVDYSGFSLKVGIRFKF